MPEDLNPAATPEPVSTEAKPEAPVAEAKADAAEPKVEAKDEKPKTAEEPKEEPKVENYDLKLPDGSLLDASHVEKVTSYAKENGLSTQNAQKLLERDNATVVEYANAQKKALQDMNAQWVEQLKSDKDFGGEAFNKNAETVKHALKRFGGEEFAGLLEETGLGNHPGLVRFVHNLVQAGEMSEDKFVLAGAQNGVEQKPIEDIFYPRKDK